MLLASDQPGPVLRGHAVFSNIAASGWARCNNLAVAQTMTAAGQTALSCLTPEDYWRREICVVYMGFQRTPSCPRSAHFFLRQMTCWIGSISSNQAGTLRQDPPFAPELLHVALKSESTDFLNFHIAAYKSCIRIMCVCCLSVSHMRLHAWKLSH